MTAVLVTLAVLFAYVSYKGEKNAFYTKATNSLALSTHRDRLISKFRNHSRFVTCLVTVIFFTSVPIYVLRLTDSNQSYSSHWNTYSWTISFSFLESELMGVLVLCVWASAVCVLCVYVMRYSEENGAICRALRDKNDDTGSQWNGFVLLAFACNLSVTLLVNVLYILSTTELSLSPSVSFAIRFGVSFYRLVSSGMIVPYLAKQVADEVRKSVFMLRLLLLNNILIPCVVTALTSSNCFHVCDYPP